VSVSGTIDPSSDAHACLVVLRDEALLVANTGRTFTRTGVISISEAHLSDKAARRPIDEYESVPDVDLIEAIQQKTLSLYRQYPNRLTEDSNLEHEVGRDYGGRVLWELLQNCDDAMSPDGSSGVDLIGNKGLGFKSVLEVTDSPQVFSGPFRMGFSSKTTRNVLRRELDLEDPPPLTFRIPHPCLADAEIETLLTQYTTVVSAAARGRCMPKDCRVAQRSDASHAAINATSRTARSAPAKWGAEAIHARAEDHFGRHWIRRPNHRADRTRWGWLQRTFMDVSRLVFV
jgi:hypothetical protein